MFCAQCGAKNADNSKFCSSCGTPITSIQNTALNANTNLTTGTLTLLISQAPSSLLGKKGEIDLIINGNSIDKTLEFGSSKSFELKPGIYSLELVYKAALFIKKRSKAISFTIEAGKDISLIATYDMLWGRFVLNKSF